MAMVSGRVIRTVVLGQIAIAIHRVGNAQAQNTEAIVTIAYRCKYKVLVEGLSVCVKQLPDFPAREPKEFWGWPLACLRARAALRGENDPP